ncbi:MAG: DUF2520 domain-containing protein [Candidatus Aminicenantes bacterium]|nr:MAG: DUF2520 domain-containing protein [Candidatus Aminicenantes bacterium]
MMNVSIIGAGRLGTSLGYALSRKGYRIKALSCKTTSSVEESRKIIGQGNAFTENARAAKEGDLVFLCLPDEEIVRVTKELAVSGIEWPNKFVFHCSGLLTSEILKPLKDKEALIGSFHPIQAFSQKRAGEELFENIYFGLEGCSKALVLSQKIARQLGGHPLILQAKDKAIYHAACSIASNFFIVLIDMAFSLLEHIGVQEKQAFQAILPLVKGNLHNVKKFNIKRSLTGPVVRGDRESVSLHLAALREFPSYHEAYLTLAKQALEMAKKQKRLSPQKIKAMEDLLEGK